MPAWMTQDRQRKWGSEDFGLEADGIIASAVEQVKAAAAPVVEPIQRAAQSFAVPSLASLTAGWLDPPDPASAQPATTDAPSQDGASSLRNFSVPDVSSLVSGWVNPTPPATAAPAAASGTPAAMPTTGGSAADTGVGVAADEAWARQEAQRLGIDPDTAVAVANTEGGFSRPARQNKDGAPAYGPYQLYIGGPEQPGLGDEALARGIDPRNASHNRAAITYALEHAAKNGWGAFQGAAANGIGDWDGIGQAPAAATAPPRASAPAAFSAAPAGELTPNQYTASKAEGLDDETAWAVCGPAAAIAFARKNGRNPSMTEAVELAKQVGWTAASGMAGPASQQQLLTRMGIASKLEDGAPDWQRVAADVQRGNPVTISTPGHYFVAERYDPSTGAFDFGNSAAILRASGGRRWFKPEELGSLGMGEARAALYLDNPASPAPSVSAGRSEAPQAQAAPQAADSAPWSPDGPVDAPAASQAPTGRAGGGGIQYRAPLSSQPELPPEAPVIADPTITDSSYTAPPYTPPEPVSQAAPAEPDSPLKPVWDAAGAVVGYVQQTASNVLDALGPSESLTPEEERARNASVAGVEPGATTLTTPPRPYVPTRDPVQAFSGEPDYVPREQAPISEAISSTIETLTGPEGLLEPAGGLPRQLARVREINAIAARDQGREDSFRARFDAADDPTWRAAHPELATEYDEVQRQLTMTVGGTVEPSKLVGRAAGAAARLLPEGAQAIRATEAAEVGRLRLDKFPEELRADIEQGARATDFAHEQRRGVLPDAAVQDLAAGEAQSVDAWIKKGRAGKAYNPEETVAVRNAVTTQAETVRGLTERIAEAKADGLDPVLLNAQRVAESQKLAALVQVAEGARSEAGRTLRAYRATTNILENNAPSAAAQRIMKNISDDPEEAGRMLDTFHEIVQNGGSPIELAKFWGKVENPPIGWKDWFVALRYNSMLSGLSTHLVNLVGNAVEIPWRLTRDLGAGVLKGDLGPVSAEFRGIATGFSAGLHAAGEAFTHGLTTAEAAAGGLPRDLISRASNPVEKVAAMALELPGRALAAADQLGTQIAYHMNLGREAALQASREGLKGAEWNARLAELLAEPTDAISRAAQGAAERMTFKGDMGKAGTAMNTFLRSIDPALSNIIMPFMKTVYHITARGLDRSPVGAVTTAIDVAKGKYAAGTALEKGMVPLGERVGDNLMGTAVFGLGAYWALQGNLSASGPSDKEKRTEMVAQGWQPYSVKIGDKWVSYANLGPLAMPLSMAAATGESQRYKDASKPTEVQFLEGGKRFAEVFTEQTYLSSFGQLYKSVTDPVRYGDAYMTSLLGSVVPYGSALNAVGQATDPNARRPERFQDVGVAENARQSLASRNVPFTGGRSTVPEAQDVLGRPIPNNRYGLEAGSPLRTSQERPDPTIQLFQEAGVDIGAPRDQVTLRAGAPPIALTTAEQRRWNTERGQQLQQAAAGVIASPSYQSADKASREMVLKRVLSMAADAADKQIISSLGEAEIRRRLTEAVQKKAS